jgi:hypothetical protein
MPQDCDRHKRIIFNPGCPVDICEDISVKVPIEVCAHSEVCDVEFRCTGHTIERIPCPDNNRECSRFNVIQRISLRIPLKFVAQCDVGEGVADFDLRECNSTAPNSTTQ